MESRLKTDIESQKWEPAESEFKPTIKSNSQKAKFNQNLERVIKTVIKKKKQQPELSSESKVQITTQSLSNRRGEGRVISKC